MTPSDIAILKTAVAQCAPIRGSYVAWMPDAQTSREVAGIEPHTQTGQPVATLSDDGEYVDLGEAELRDFALVTRLA